MPTARFDASATVLDEKIYLMGGMGGDYGNHFKVDANEVYEPATDTWSIKTPLPTPRWGLVGAALGGKVYAIAGANDTGILDVVEVYDPLTDSWETGAPLPAGGVWAGVAVLSGKIYVLGGSLDGSSVSSDEVVVFDPGSDSWSYAAPLLSPRQSMSVGTLNGKIYLFGGWLGRSDVEEYDPLGGTSSPMNPLPYGVAGSGAGTIGGRIYIAGGVAESEYDAVGLVYEFDVASNTYQMASPMIASRGYISVGAINDKMYAIGGSYASEAMSDNQEFTPPQPENSPPTCTITNLDNEQTVEGVVQVQGTATDPDGDGQIVRVEVDIDGFGWELATGTTSWDYSWDTTTAKPGYHTIHARAYDGQEYSNHYWIVVEIPQPKTVAEDDLLFFALLGAVIFLVLMVVGMFLARPRSGRGR
ncbi:MAG: Ig-like domain-containing protein [Thermoplasmata archaeon]